MEWQPNWETVRRHFRQWWAGEGLVLHLTAPTTEPIEPIAEPQQPADWDHERIWTDPGWRRQRAEYQMAHTYWAADSFPYLDTQIGPGSLGLFLGAEPVFEPTTVWYRPCLTDDKLEQPIRFAPNKWWHTHLALVHEALAHADGRYLVGMPDLIENIDTLAAMRDNETLLFDLIERPQWVTARVAEINQAFFAAFDAIFELIQDADGGNAFSAFRIWGPGKTAKVQCDFCCMISPPMFREFVMPGLSEQCDWLDYSMYHLDGTNAMQHVEALCEIPSLQAIEWTPQAGLPGGGDPQWYDLYRRIRAGGKSVQAVGVRADQVIPLLDAVGPQGLYIMAHAESPEAADALVEQVAAYRD